MCSIGQYGLPCMLHLAVAAASWLGNSCPTAGLPKRRYNNATSTHFGFGSFGSFFEPRMVFMKPLNADLMEACCIRFCEFALSAHHPNPPGRPSPANADWQLTIVDGYLCVCADCAACLNICAALMDSQSLQNQKLHSLACQGMTLGFGGASCDDSAENWQRKCNLSLITQRA